MLFKNETDSEESHKPSTVGTRLSMCKDKHDPASSPESYASAKDGVSFIEMLRSTNFKVILNYVLIKPLHF